MKMIKPTINVKYQIESCDGFLWETEDQFSLLDEAVEELAHLRRTRPNAKYRLIRSEWEVIG